MKVCLEKEIHVSSAVFRVTQCKYRIELSEYCVCNIAASLLDRTVPELAWPESPSPLEDPLPQSVGKPIYLLYTLTLFMPLTEAMVQDQLS